MKKNAWLLLLASFTLINLSSCSKDDDDNGGSPSPTPVTNTSKLCNKNWKFTSIVVDGTDITSFVPSCNIDDFIRFSTDGTTVFDEGPTKCDPADPQTTPGTWSWLNNETKLVLDSDTADVITNSGEVLKLSLDDGTSVTVITFGL